MRPEQISRDTNYVPQQDGALPPQAKTCPICAGFPLFNIFDQDAGPLCPDHARGPSAPLLRSEPIPLRDAYKSYDTSDFDRASSHGSSSLLVGTSDSPLHHAPFSMRSTIQSILDPRFPALISAQSPFLVEANLFPHPISLSPLQSSLSSSPPPSPSHPFRDSSIPPSPPSTDHSLLTGDAKFGVSPTAAKPYMDITRLRMRPQSRGALYSGSVFAGFQRSGQNSYNVTVTLVNVDLASSFLCGYLRIQNLTDDYPDMTTYFDAEIIGSRYGFLTSDEWGANESDDMKHWDRFPAFRPLKGELRRPGLTMRERDRGVVFMRWKERFLVPDHKTKEINGASFAGFYYVAINEATEDSPAIMTGFYFHPNSEPYQQLSLKHVPTRVTSSFEFC